MALHEFIRERLMVSLNGGIKENITAPRIKACPQTDQRGGQYVRGEIVMPEVIIGIDAEWQSGDAANTILSYQWYGIDGNRC